MFSIKINCQIRVIGQGIRKIATINTLPKNIPQIPKRNWVPKNYEFSEFNNASQNFSKSSKFDWTDLIDEDLIEKVLEDNDEKKDADQNKPVLIQMGKTTEDCFNVDVRYPVSLLQAFAVCVTRLDSSMSWA